MLLSSPEVQRGALSLKRVRTAKKGGNRLFFLKNPLDNMIKPTSSPHWWHSRWDIKFPWDVCHMFFNYGHFLALLSSNCQSLTLRSPLLFSCWAAIYSLGHKNGYPFSRRFKHSTVEWPADNGTDCTMAQTMMKADGFYFGFSPWLAQCHV